MNGLGPGTRTQSAKEQLKGLGDSEAGVRSLSGYGAHSPQKQAEKPRLGASQQERVRLDSRRNRLGGWTPKQMRCWCGEAGSTLSEPRRGSSSEGDICMTPLSLKDQNGPLQVAMETRGLSLLWPGEVGEEAGLRRGLRPGGQGTRVWTEKGRRCPPPLPWGREVPRSTVAGGPSGRTPAPNPP